MLNTIININLHSDLAKGAVNLLDESGFWTYVNELLDNAQKLLRTKSRPNEEYVLDMVYEIEHIYTFTKLVVDKRISTGKIRQRLKRKVDRIDRYLPQLVTYLPISKEFLLPPKVEKIETESANIVRIYSALGKELDITISNLSVPHSKSEFEQMRLKHESEQRNLEQHQLPVERLSRVTTQNPEVAYLYREMGKNVIFETV